MSPNPFHPNSSSLDSAPNSIVNNPFLSNLNNPFRIEEDASPQDKTQNNSNGNPFRSETNADNHCGSMDAKERANCLGDVEMNGLDSLVSFFPLVFTSHLFFFFSSILCCCFFNVFCCGAVFFVFLFLFHCLPFSVCFFVPNLIYFSRILVVFVACN